MTAAPKTLGERLRHARRLTAGRRDENVSQERMAQLVGEIVGRSLHQTLWSHYEHDRHEPPLDVISATARLSGLSETYLAFGYEPEALIDPERDRKLTPEEEERAMREADRLRAARTSPGKRRPRGA